MQHDHDDLDATRPPAPSLTRRETMRWLAALVASGPLASLIGCEPESEEASSGDGDDAGGSDAGAAADSGSSEAQAAADSGAGTAWAQGGTAAMTAIASYPNPFAGAVDTSCTPTCAMVEGPCHDDQAPEREDISEGQTGLPMRFALRVLDADCKPVTDADVDIWHCDVRGVYSSETADNPPFCTGSDQAALAARYFRGHRMTDENGVAWFNTCFPGWYSGRAIHIHFTVRRSNRQGQEYLTSQLAFDAALIQELCSSHPDYVAHGQPNTANTADSIFPSASVDDYVMKTERMSDGAVLASKTIIIRSALSDSVCSAGGNMPGGPGGMMGGPPPGF